MSSIQIKTDKLIFAIALLVGLFIQHDLFQIGLAISSFIVGIWVTRGIVARKWRIPLFVFSVVVLMQMSVFVREGILEGFVVVGDKYPVGEIVKAILYGFIHVSVALYDSCIAMYNAIMYNEYALVEKLNYRFVVSAWLVFVTAFLSLFRKRPKPS